MHLPPTGKNYRYWGIVIKYEVLLALYKSMFAPYIGRIAFARSSDIWQPTSNPNADYDEELVGQSILHETDDQTLETSDRAIRRHFRLHFPSMPLADFQTGKRIFERLEKEGDLLALLRPAQIARGITAPTGPEGWTFDPLYCQFDRDFSVKGRPAGRGSFDLELREIAGGRDIYGGIE